MDMPTIHITLPIIIIRDTIEMWPIIREDVIFRMITIITEGMFKTTEPMFRTEIQNTPEVFKTTEVPEREIMV